MDVFKNPNFKPITSPSNASHSDKGDSPHEKFTFNPNKKKEASKSSLSKPQTINFQQYNFNNEGGINDSKDNFILNDISLLSSSQNTSFMSVDQSRNDKAFFKNPMFKQEKSVDHPSELKLMELNDNSLIDQSKLSKNEHSFTKIYYSKDDEFGKPKIDKITNVNTDNGKFEEQTKHSNFPKTNKNNDFENSIKNESKLDYKMVDLGNPNDLSKLSTIDRSFIKNAIGDIKNMEGFKDNFEAQSASSKNESPVIGDKKVVEQNRPSQIKLKQKNEDISYKKNEEKKAVAYEQKESETANFQIDKPESNIISMSETNKKVENLNYESFKIEEKAAQPTEPLYGLAAPKETFKIHEHLYKNERISDKHIGGLTSNFRLDEKIVTSNYIYIDSPNMKEYLNANSSVDRFSLNPSNFDTYTNKFDSNNTYNSKSEETSSPKLILKTNYNQFNYNEEDRLSDVKETCSKESFQKSSYPDIFADIKFSEKVINKRQDEFLFKPIQNSEQNNNLLNLEYKPPEKTNQFSHLNYKSEKTDYLMGLESKPEQTNFYLGFDCKQDYNKPETSNQLFNFEYKPLNVVGAANPIATPIFESKLYMTDPDQIKSSNKIEVFTFETRKESEGSGSGVADPNSFPFSNDYVYEKPKNLEVSENLKSKETLKKSYHDFLQETETLLESIKKIENPKKTVQSSFQDLQTPNLNSLSSYHFNSPPPPSLLVPSSSVPPNLLPPSSSFPPSLFPSSSSVLPPSSSLPRLSFIPFSSSYPQSSFVSPPSTLPHPSSFPLFPSSLPPSSSSLTPPSANITTPSYSSPPPPSFSYFPSLPPTSFPPSPPPPLSSPPLPLPTSSSLPPPTEKSFAQPEQIEIQCNDPITFRNQEDPNLSNTSESSPKPKNPEKPVRPQTITKSIQSSLKPTFEVSKKEDSSLSEDNRITFGVTIPVVSNPNNSNLSGNSEKKMNIEENLFLEVTALKDKVVRSLENYQKIIHKKETKNFKQEIKRDFLNISKDLSELYGRYGELNTSLDNNEGVNSSLLRTGGPKEEEINNMMCLINEFVQKFAEVVKSKENKKDEKPKHMQNKTVELEDQIHFIEKQKRERKLEKMEQSFMSIKSNNITAFDFEENIQNLNDTTDISISRICRPSDAKKESVMNFKKNEPRRRQHRKLRSFGFLPKKFMMKYQKNLDLKSNDLNIELQCTCNRLFPIQVIIFFLF